MSLRDEIVEIIETTVYFSKHEWALLAADDAADLIVDKLRELGVYICGQGHVNCVTEVGANDGAH